MMTKKATEKMLYEIWLDLTLALGTAEDYIHDTELELKIMRKARNKTKKLLKTATEHYKTVYRKEPKIYKR